MNPLELPEHIVLLDEETLAVHLEVPGAQVVLLQAYFETHEGLGTVRTIDMKSSHVCVLTTSSQFGDCQALLEAVRKTIHWRPRKAPLGSEAKRYFGYFRKENNAKNLSQK